jgi:hypothetical protein
VIGLDAPPAVVAAALGVAALVVAAAVPGLRRDRPHPLQVPPGHRPRPLPWRRIGRIAALGAALVGLLGLALRPHGPAPVRGGDRALLATAGSEEEEGGTGGGRQVTPASLRVREDGGGWRALPDARTLWRREPWLRHLEVSGYGLDAADLAGFQGVIDRFTPPPLPAGATAALWPRHIQLGAPLAVELRTSPATAGPVELRGPGGVEAAAGAAAARRGVTLVARPRAAGRFLYQMEVRDAAGRVVGGAPLDVTVAEPRPPRVLVRLGAPSFESRALLRFLAAARVPFVAGLEVTRGREHVEEAWPAGYGEPPAVAPLDAVQLARCDVLLLDGRGWKTLAAGERAAVAAAGDAGLGVLLFAADPAQGEEDGFALRSRPLAGAAGGEERLAWPGEEPLAPLALPAREILPAPGAEPLASAGGQRVIAARLRLGGGALSLSLASRTFAWTLGGENRSFAALWSRLLSAVARPDPAPVFLLPAGPIVVDRPLDVTLVAPAARRAGPPRITAAAGGVAVELPVVAAGPGRFVTRLWPRDAGWLQLASSDGAVAWIHAAGAGSWRAWRRAERVAATRRRAAPADGSVREAAPALPGGPPGHPPAPPGRPWPRLPFYALFLAGAGALWLDERVVGGGSAAAPRAQSMRGQQV